MGPGHSPGAIHVARARGCQGRRFRRRWQEACWRYRKWQHYHLGLRQSANNRNPRGCGKTLAIIGGHSRRAKADCGALEGIVSLWDFDVNSTPMTLEKN